MYLKQIVFAFSLMIGLGTFFSLPTQVRAQETSPDYTANIVGNRGAQNMNPDISAIIDFTSGWWQRRPTSLAGDDPEFGGSANTPGGGFTVQEAEVGIQSVIDPYLRGDVFLTIPNLGNLEVEEAFVTTTDLPADLQLKAGVFRSSISREVSQHLHLQDFTRRPLINQTLLGVDGLRAPGMQLNWLVPMPFYSLFLIEGFAVPSADDPTEPLQTFGGGPKGQLTGTAAWKNFFTLGEDTSISWGLDYGQGRSSQAPNASTGIIPIGNNLQSQIFGTDLYVKFKPPNVADGFYSFAWQTEYFQRHLIGDNTISDTWDGGMYTQFVFQVAQRWFFGVRGDFLGLPASQFVRPEQRYSASITWAGSEFSKIRLYAEQDTVATADFPADSPASSTAVMLQMEVAMGAHGAHPF